MLLRSMPVIVRCPAAITVESPNAIPMPANSWAGFSDAGGAATDTCDSALTASYTDSRSGCPEVITRTWAISNDCGKSAICTQTITVQDTIKPTITCPQDITVPADRGNGYASGVDLGTPITFDNCGVLSVTNNAPDRFQLGDTPVTWTVTDRSGNTATCTQKVTVISVCRIVVNEDVNRGSGVFIKDKTLETMVTSGIPPAVTPYEIELTCGHQYEVWVINYQGQWLSPKIWQQTWHKDGYKIVGTPAPNGIDQLHFSGGECAPPEITIQPLSNEICPGGSTSFTVGATGTSLTYTWFKVGSDQPLTTGGNIQSILQEH